VQVLRVEWRVYPRRAEHNTVAEGGDRRWAETARQNSARGLEHGGLFSRVGPTSTTWRGASLLKGGSEKQSAI
jgi:hypothetical protein